MKKYIITIVTVALVVLIFALGGYYYLTKDDKATMSNQTINQIRTVKKEKILQLQMEKLQKLLLNLLLLMALC